VTRPDFVLSTHEFELLWHDLELGAIPYPLAVPRMTPRQRQLLADETLRELDERGLLRHGQLVPELERMLCLLAVHEFAVDTVAHIGYPLRALAATNRVSAVLAMLAGGEVWLSDIRPDALAHASIGLLLPCEAGPGQGISVPYPALLEAADATGSPVSKAVLLAAGMSDVDTAALLELADSRHAGGQFGVTVQDGGVARRVDALVAWCDTSRGRYLMVHDDARLFLAPADVVRLEQRLTECLSDMDTKPQVPRRREAP
jgi:hypothetical protein